MPLTLPSRGWAISREDESGDVLYSTDAEGAIQYFPSFEVAVAHMVKFSELTADEVIDIYCIEQSGCNHA